MPVPRRLDLYVRDRVGVEATWPSRPGLSPGQACNAAGALIFTLGAEPNSPRKLRSTTLQGFPKLKPGRPGHMPENTRKAITTRVRIFILADSLLRATPQIVPRQAGEQWYAY